MKRISPLAVVAAVSVIACSVHQRVQPPIARRAEFDATCRALWLEQLGRAIDPQALAACIDRAIAGETGEQIRAWLHDQPEAVAYRERLARPPVPSAGERGRLRRDGLVFRREDGSIFQWRGFSDFRLFEKFLVGGREAVAPLLKERVALGANILRVFLMYAPPELGGGIGRLFPHEHAGYYAMLRAFADLLAEHGLRAEFVVFADAQIIIPDERAQERHLDQVTAALAAAPNAVLEIVNEPFKNIPGGAARAEQLASLVPKSFLVAYGNYDVDMEQQEMLSVGDYLTVHTERKPEWVRTPRAIGELRDGAGARFRGVRRPVVADEPTGFAEVQRGDSRSTSADDAAYYAGTAALMGAGATFHSDDGIQSRLLGPVQMAAAAAWFVAMKFVPAEAQIAPYARGGVPAGCGGWVGERLVEHDDDRELRTFGKVVGDQAFVVQIRTTRARATPCQGWRVVDEPRRGFVRLARD